MARTERGDGGGGGVEGGKQKDRGISYESSHGAKWRKFPNKRASKKRQWANFDQMGKVWRCYGGQQNHQNHQNHKNISKHSGQFNWICRSINIFIWTMTIAWGTWPAKSILKSVFLPLIPSCEIYSSFRGHTFIPLFWYFEIWISRSPLTCIYVFLDSWVLFDIYFMHMFWATFVCGQQILLSLTAKALYIAEDMNQTQYQGSARMNTKEYQNHNTTPRSNQCF